MSSRYIDNIVEQYHRAIKRRCAWMTGCKSFPNAATTLAGIELAHRIRKRQFSIGLGRQRRRWSLKQLWASLKSRPIYCQRTSDNGSERWLTRDARAEGTFGHWIVVRH